jgi:lactoylglutathione lyase
MPPATGPNELRVVLTVADHQQAVRFYRDALGLTELADWSSEHGKVVLLDGGHATIEVGRRVAGPVRLALRAEDSAAVASGLEQAGAERLNDLVQTPWGDRNVRLRAPDGMQLTLFTTP